MVFKKGHPNYNKNCKFTREQRMKGVEIRKKLYAEGKIKPWNKGLKLPPISESHKKIISEANKGKIMKETTKEKIRNFFKDIPFEERYGKDRANIIREKIRIKKLGTKMSIESSNKKRNYKSPLERNLKISKSMIGKQKSKEHIEKASINRIKTCKERGYYFTDETKNIMKAKRAKQKKTITSKIEIKIREFLEQLQIEYFQHRYISEITHGYQCDFLIPSKNMVIECDGNYWHSYPIGNEIDHIRTSELIGKGFRVIRLWESEIKVMDIDKFVNIIK
jgi:very-short-patch-repair endonuclease